MASSPRLKPRLSWREGVVGIAMLGADAHVERFAARIAANASAKLIVVVDSYASAAREVAGKFGADAMTDHAAAIDRDDVEAIVIDCSADLHGSLLARALSQGKAVYCINPVARTVAACLGSLAENIDIGDSLMLALDRRPEKAVGVMCSAIASGHIGDVHHVTITRPVGESCESLDGLSRTIPGLTIQDLDDARTLLGEEPAAVVALSSSLAGAAVVEHRQKMASILLETASGKHCLIHAYSSSVSGEERRIEVRGYQGLVVLASGEVTLSRWGEAPVSLSFEPPSAHSASSLHCSLDVFVQHLVERRRFPVAALEDLALLRVSDGAFESASSGKIVRL